MKLRSFIKRFKRVINLVSVLSNTSDYFLWIQAYLKLFIHSVLLGKIYILLTYLVFNVQIMVETSGIEPLTSCVQSRRSPSWAKAPWKLLSGRQDSNLRPLGPKPSALPSWATSRYSINLKMARPIGVEPITSWSVVKRSIQLSYGR